MAWSKATAESLVGCRLYPAVEASAAAVASFLRVPRLWDDSSHLRVIGSHRSSPINRTALPPLKPIAKLSLFKSLPDRQLGHSYRDCEGKLAVVIGHRRGATDLWVADQADMCGCRRSRRKSCGLEMHGRALERLRPVTSGTETAAAPASPIKTVMSAEAILGLRYSLGWYSPTERLS